MASCSLPIPRPVGPARRATPSIVSAALLRLAALGTSACIVEQSGDHAVHATTPPRARRSRDLPNPRAELTTNYSADSAKQSQMRSHLILAKLSQRRWCHDRTDAPYEQGRLVVTPWAPGSLRSRSSRGRGLALPGQGSRRGKKLSCSTITPAPAICPRGQNEAGAITRDQAAECPSRRRALIETAAECLPPSLIHD